MKPKEFHAFLLRASDFLRARHARDDETLRALARIFETAPEKSVAKTTERLRDLNLSTGSFLETKVQSASSVLLALHRLMAGIAKEAALKDIALLSEALEDHESAGLAAFVMAATKAVARPPVRAGAARKPRATKTKQPLRVDLVARYQRRLEQALGDDPGFKSVFDQLRSDDDLGTPEAKALAKQFAHATANTKDTALKKIFARHQALMTSRAKSQATAGRIAG